MTRLDFARAYVYHRGTLRDDRPTSPVQMREERDVAYMDELREFFRDVVGNPDWTPGRRRDSVSPAAWGRYALCSAVVRRMVVKLI